MTEQPDHQQIAWWATNIDELDREIGRLCTICEVRILDPGVSERVLKKDASARNTEAHSFRKSCTTYSCSIS